MTSNERSDDLLAAAEEAAARIERLWTEGARGDRCLAYSLLDLGLQHQQAYDRIRPAGSFHVAKARASLERALELYRSLGDHYYEGMALANLGVVAWSEKNPQQAITLLGQAIELSYQLGETPWHQWAVNRRRFYVGATCGFREAVRVVGGDEVEAVHRRENSKEPLATSAPSGRDFVEALLENHGETVDLALRRNPAVATYRGPTGLNPLHCAKSLSDMKAILRAIPRDHRRESVNARDERGMTPLHVAMKQGRCDLVRLLLKHGASLDVADRTGETPRAIAISSSDKEIVRIVRKRRWNK